MAVQRGKGPSKPHKVPELTDCEVALHLLDMRWKAQHKPQTFVRNWKYPYKHNLRNRGVWIRVRFWPDMRRPVNYIIHSNQSRGEAFQKQRINTNDGAKCLAKLLEILNE